MTKRALTRTFTPTFRIRVRALGAVAASIVLSAGQASPADAQIGKWLKRAAETVVEVANSTTSMPGNRTLAPGQTTGTLHQGSRVIHNGRTDVYSFQGRRGERVELRMASQRFNPVLAFGRYDDGEWIEILANDNAGNATTDARIHTVLDDDGEYVVLATGHGYPEGPYSLSFTSAPPTYPQTGDPQPKNSRAGMRPIQAGQVIEAALDRADPSIRGGRSELYTFAGNRGERVDLRLDSEEFNAIMEFGRFDGDDWVTIHANDNAGNATENARVLTVLDDNTQYVVRVTGHGYPEGIYTLRLAVTPPAYPITDDPQPPTSRAGLRPIRIGQTIEAALDQGDPDIAGGRSEQYTFTGKAAQRVNISLASADFNAILELGRFDGDDWVAIATNDNAGSATSDARVVTALPSAGAYIIRVRGHGYPEGIYTLRLAADSQR